MAKYTIKTIFHGPLINPTSLLSFDTIPKCLVGVNSDGNIAWIERDVSDGQVKEAMDRKGHLHSDGLEVEVIELKEGQFIMPGFIDTHTHAPQVPNIGTGYRYELLEWLEKYTFPLEAQFADVEYAKKVYPEIVKRFIQCGTTTCCYYSTIHLASSKVLADIVHSVGQRALIGKCNMDRHCPEYYREESAQRSVEDTRAFIKYVEPLPLVYPVVTPRFAISCSRELLAGLGELANAASTSPLHIQTHISENPSEVAWAGELFPECKNYASIYDKYHLLRRGTILAHGVWLDEDEVALIQERGSGISHCPTSNFNLKSGVAPVGRYLDCGVKVGLGTDVSGGFSPSMLVTMRNASIASTVVALGHQHGRLNCATSGSTSTYDHGSNSGFSGSPLALATLFFLATLGGAQVCALEDRIGSLDVGKAWDALIVDLQEGSNPALWSQESEEEERNNLAHQLERFIFCGDDRNVYGVWVQGRLIGGTSFVEGSK
ncbi:hypothetical protein BDP27DRAFT_1324738 [Rhodocollybia butyracea]|uniref:Guanine deaminase n=1 Tax=Rhodocollybia butyracea TaxID=206335 RepID=A0A9P5U8C0_9AGAR|nr:hypothetical protein BDP27DRAFT_1324738 [Rhodocollybia butyracea]